MPADSTQAPIPDETLRHLQEALLTAVLHRRPLPGGRRPVDLPDLRFALQQDQILVLDQDVAGPLAVPDTGKPVVLVSQVTLADRAAGGGPVAFLRFYPPEIEDHAVVLTLAVALAAPAPTPVTNLSSMRVRFRNAGGEWAVDGEPVLMAY